MGIRQLIGRNLKKHLQKQPLYLFALIFSVALYTSFVTLRYDPALELLERGVRGAAAIQSASVLLVAIITTFLLYANNLFIKQRSREIALLQLVGLTKARIFQILAAENTVLYFGSLIAGILAGISFSKLVMMLLLKITQVEAVAELHFSLQATIQTVIVFTAIFLLIQLRNSWFLNRQSILSLFRLPSTSEEKVKRFSFLNLIVGLGGMALIAFGYYLSTRLFDGTFVGINALFSAMVSILASVIIGTYLFYKGSVSLIFHLIRKSRRGFLRLNQVLSLSSVMFRMKSNSLLLTVITTVSALAIGLLSLSYISYYSAEKMARQLVPHHFSFMHEEDAQRFTQALDEQQIGYRLYAIEVFHAEVDLSRILATDGDLLADPVTILPVVKDSDVEGVDVEAGQALLVGDNSLLKQAMPLKKSGPITLLGQNRTLELNYLGTKEGALLPQHYTAGGLPVVVVDENAYHSFKTDIQPDLQKGHPVYYGIDLEHNGDLERAGQMYSDLGLDQTDANGFQMEVFRNQIQTTGLTMFIVAFLGLAFLITSGCVLYFKQVDESEEERPNYTILRKLGFTEEDLLRGIRIKQLFNFGIPLAAGLSHSYFAVKSGWFLFGTEMWTPMLLVMIFYTGLYSVFGLLSVLHYKKVIRQSL